MEQGLSLNHIKEIQKILFYGNLHLMILHGWDSPWGYGRPGWHIECTSMIKSIIGDDDIRYSWRRQ